MMSDKIGLSEKEYFSIGEVTEILHIKDYVIRFWEKKFKQLSPLVSTKGNRRRYTHGDIQIIAQIQDLLYHQGFTLAGAQRYLDEHPVEQPTNVPSARKSLVIKSSDSSSFIKQQAYFNAERQYCIDELNKILHQIKQLSIND